MHFPSVEFRDCDVASFAEQDQSLAVFARGVDALRNALAFIHVDLHD